MWFPESAVDSTAFSNQKYTFSTKYTCLSWFEVLLLEGEMYVKPEKSVIRKCT